MIARMSKYDLVLYAGQSSDFIEKLRGDRKSTRLNSSH